MIPNAELIRAVLDGKQVELRSKGAQEWRTFANPESAISHLAGFHGHSFEFRIKPEAKKVWLYLNADGESGSDTYREFVVDAARYDGAKKLYRVEIDADTGEPIGVFVEDVE